MKARQTELVYSALTRWGYTKFREGKGQEEATMRLDTRGMANEGILVLAKSMPGT